MESTDRQGLKRKRELNATELDEIPLKQPRTEFRGLFNTTVMSTSTEAVAVSDRYQLLERLGEGTFGLWYKVRDKQTKQLVAVKKLKQHNNMWAKHDLRHANIGLALSHPNLRQVLDVVSAGADSSSQDLKVLLIAEYCDHDLATSLQYAQPFSEHYIKSAMRQLLSAVEYLHKNHVMHRDIKPAEIFLKGGEIKLELSGMMREYPTDGALTPVVVTLWYRAPELLLGLKQYDFAVDMWSLGCVMAEMFLRRPLMFGNSVPDMLAGMVEVLGPVRHCAWPDLAELSPMASCLLHGPDPAVPLAQLIPHLSHTAYDLLRGLLCYNPHERLTAREALQHEWFNDLAQ